MTAWGRLLVVCGPSGVGKGTVVAELLARRPDIWLSISTTTRSPRPGEVDGVAYHFVSRAEFERTVAQGAFWSGPSTPGNLYGTAVAPVAARLDAGDVVVLEIDLEGARRVRRSHPDALFVFLAPRASTNCGAGCRSGGRRAPRSWPSDWIGPSTNSRPRTSSTMW